MSLIQAEQDDVAVLKAEDEAIARATEPPVPEIDDIAALIERLTNDPTTTDLSRETTG